METSLCKEKTQMNNFCKERGIDGWFETSAKQNKGIEDAIQFMIQICCKINCNKICIEKEIVDLFEDNEESRVNPKGCCFKNRKD